MSHGEWDDRTFMGASSFWDKEGDLAEDVRQEVASRLRNSLKSRIATLNLMDLSVDDLLTECRRQIAEAALDGNIQQVEDRTAMILQLLETQDVR